MRDCYAKITAPIEIRQDAWMVENLRNRKVIYKPGDFGIKESNATRDLLSAKTIKDIIEPSGGLYHPQSSAG